MTAGVPREARSLSGCDLGREIQHWGEWVTIDAIRHDQYGVFIEWSGARINGASRYRAHDVVQVRGRTP